MTIFSTKPNPFQMKPVYDAIDAKFAELEVALGKKRKGVVKLSGANPTRVLFKATEAAKATSNAGPFNLASVGDGATLIVTTDTESAETATINVTKGISVSGASPSTSIATESDAKFNISVDGDAAELVTLTLTGLTSGAAIATQLQTAIRAKGGKKAAVTVDYDVTVAGKYVVASGTLGSGSSVVITPSAVGSITEELKLGADSGGTETAGTGDVANIAAATAEEIAAVIATDMEKCTASVVAGKLVITSKTVVDSKITLGNGTANTALGFTNAQVENFIRGLGYDTDMANADYNVVATLKGAASPASLGLSITTPTAAGFSIVCQTANSVADVYVQIEG